MKKIVLLLTCILWIGFSLKTEARGYQVWDQAGLLTENEINELKAIFGSLEDESAWNIMVVTTADAKGMDGTEYAETWFDDNTDGEDGLILLLDMDNREIVIRTFGEAIRYLTDERIEDILDQAYDRVGEQEYAAALYAMASGAKEAWQMGIPKDQYTYDEDTGEILDYQKPQKKITLAEALLALGVALVAGGITIGSIIGRYRLKWGGYKYSFRENGSVELTEQKDIFINQVITHRKIPKDPPDNSSGGGKSTVHTGAGGRSSGGGSRKF